MINITPYSAASTSIAVTGTSTALYALMNTAGSVNEVGPYYTKNAANGLIITPEDGNVRVLIGATPTATRGILLQAGTTYTFPGIVLESFNLIRTGGSNVTCSVYPYKSKDGESITMGAGGSGGTPTNPSEIQGVDADNAPATANPVIVSGEYNATPPTYGDGDNASLQSDVNGNLKQVAATMPSAEDNTNTVYQTVRKFLSTITYQGTRFQNNSFQTFNVKNTPGLLTQLTIINTTASVRYLQVHNTTTTPAGGATAYTSYQIAANSPLVLDADQLGQNGGTCVTGIALANSSTAGTYTAGTAGDLLVTGWFV